MKAVNFITKLCKKVVERLKSLISRKDRGFRKVVTVKKDARYFPNV